ncbi:MAG: acetolactate decarboxylase [Methanospirillum sp.]|nr:acetolactate decarboxylase [Methanospirillum sp.]
MVHPHQVAVILCIALFFMVPGSAVINDTPSSNLFHVSAYSLLADGQYDGVVTVGDLKNNGTFGIGGYEHMDGELLMLDGTVWQITHDGVVYEPSDDTKVCFANIIHFNPTITHQVNETLDKAEVYTVITDLFPDDDTIYAVKVTGDFADMQARSVPSQSPPYPPLSEVIQNQSVFDLGPVTGTLTGFWFPDWMAGVNVAGFHQHFISADNTSGGHALNYTIKNVTISIQPVTGFTYIHP